MAINAAAPGKIKGTSITTPTASQDNHTLVLGQLKETTEIAQRLRGDPNDSFVRVSELVSALGARLVNGTIQPPLPSTASAVSISVADSITGTGVSGSPLQLVNDSSAPGNNMVYGTNGSGTKGWYAASGGGGSSWSITDGTHTVTSVTSLTVSGGTVGGTTPSATLTISGGGSTQYPGTLSDLQLWFDVAAMFGCSGAIVNQLQNSCPWLQGVCFFSTTDGRNDSTISSTQLNGKNVLALAGNNIYTVPSGGGCVGELLTAFVVFNDSNVSSAQALFSGGSASAELLVNGGVLSLSNAFIATIANDTTSLSSNTWYQANLTWNGSTGAWAFRVARAAGASGTASPTVTYGPITSIGGVPSYSPQNWIGSIAEVIIYNRVLSNTEISSMESYLHTKWGV